VTTPANRLAITLCASILRCACMRQWGAVESPASFRSKADRAQAHEAKRPKRTHDSPN